MSTRSPLARARGLGASNGGVTHWWRQRLSAVALVPLTFWFVVSLATRAGSGYEVTVEWLSSPAIAVPMGLYLGLAFYHSQLGLQTIIEDYVHTEWVKLLSLVAIQFANFALAAAAIFALLLISLGAN